MRVCSVCAFKSEFICYVYVYIHVLVDPPALHPFIDDFDYFLIFVY
jgi:hypothetical protein